MYLGRLIRIGANLTHGYDTQNFLILVRISIERSRFINALSVNAEDTNSNASALFLYLRFTIG